MQGPLPSLRSVSTATGGYIKAYLQAAVRISPGHARYSARRRDSEGAILLRRGGDFARTMTGRFTLRKLIAFLERSAALRDERRECA